VVDSSSKSYISVAIKKLKKVHLNKPGWRCGRQ
jgi:hypothetical protein